MTQGQLEKLVEVEKPHREPLVSRARVEATDDGFTEVTGKSTHAKTTRGGNDDSESSDFEVIVPKDLRIELDQYTVIKMLKLMVHDTLASRLPADLLQTAVISDNLAQIKHLIAQDGEDGGWRTISDYHICCLNVGRNQDIIESSALFKNFKENSKAHVTVKALIFVPGKIVVGLCDTHN